MSLAQVWRLSPGEASDPHLLSQVAECGSVQTGSSLLTCVPWEPSVAAELVWVALFMPHPCVKNDSAQETVPRGSDFPHLSLWLLGLAPVPFQKSWLGTGLFGEFDGKRRGGEGGGGGG